MKEVIISGGRIAFVDDEDFERINKLKWSTGGEPACRYAVRYTPMHHMILECPPGMVIDHIDGNGLNNTRANLRVATKSQNQMNKKPHVGKSFKGVHWKTKDKRWVAKIIVNRKHTHLGNFVDFGDALRAYNIAAKKYHGDFAKLNEIPDDATLITIMENKKKENM